MKSELVAFVLGILLNSGKHYVEGLIGQKIGDYIAKELLQLPRILHYAHGHKGPSRGCPDCNSRPVDTLTG